MPASVKGCRMPVRGDVPMVSRVELRAGVVQASREETAGSTNTVGIDYKTMAI
jgi:hypothetical protein